MVCGGLEVKEERRVVVMEVTSWRRTVGSWVRGVEGSEGWSWSWEAGADSVTCVAEEFGKRGTGGRVRTGVLGC